MVGCIYTHNALERVDQNAALGCHFFRFSVLVVGSQSRIKKVTQSTKTLINYMQIFQLNVLFHRKSLMLVLVLYKDLYVNQLIASFSQ